SCLLLFYSFTVPSPTVIYSLSLHDALPIWWRAAATTPSTLLPRPPATGRVSARGSTANRWRSCGTHQTCHSGRTMSRKRSSNTRSEEHTSELQSRENLVCRLLLEKKN